MATNLIIWLSIQLIGYPAHWKPAAKNSLTASCMMLVWEGILPIMMIAIQCYFIQIGMDPMKAALMMVRKSILLNLNLSISTHAFTSAFANTKNHLYSFNLFYFYRQGALLYAEQRPVFFIQFNRRMLRKVLWMEIFRLHWDTTIADSWRVLPQLVCKQHCYLCQ